MHITLLKQRSHLILILISALILCLLPIKVFALTPQIMFPVLGGGSYSNDFAGYRELNGTHGAIDIFAKKHTPLIAAADGYVSFVAFPQPSYGWFIQLTDDMGYQYKYIHINNDTPGTDDGAGGAMNAYAADMKRNNRVNKGQVIGYVGDSGNAENTPPHLHFEIYGPSGNLINPYEHLRAAPILYSVNPSDYVIQRDEFLPFTMNRLGVNVAYADVQGDSGQEVVVAAGAPGGPHVKIFDGTTNAYTGVNFFAYAAGFTGGVNVAAGDVDGDGKSEIITGAGPGGGPHVRVFKPNGQIVSEFFAYPGFTGGVNVAAGDVDGDGKSEIITGPGAGGGPHVRVFKPNGQVIGDFFAYPGFTGGVNVAAGDTDGDTKAEIITAAGPGAGAHIRVLSYNALVQDDKITAIRDFSAYPDAAYRGGARVTVADYIKNGSNPKSEIITVPAYRERPEVKVFGQSSQLLKSNMFAEEWWQGSYTVASNGTKIVAGMGDDNRRGSVKILTSF
jgi:hypothetical protein